MFKYILMLSLLTTPCFADGLVITPSRVGTAQVGQIPGTATNDNACAGCVGEYIESLSTSTSINSNETLSLTSISLSPGDWDVQGGVQYLPAISTTLTRLNSYLSTVQNGGTGSIQNGSSMAFASGTDVQNNSIRIVSPVVRYSLNTTTTVYINTYSAFGTSTLTGIGYIRARRVR